MKELSGHVPNSNEPRGKVSNFYTNKLMVLTNTSGKMHRVSMEFHWQCSFQLTILGDFISNECKDAESNDSFPNITSENC